MTLELLSVSAQLTQLRGDGHPYTCKPRHPGNVFSVNTKDFPVKTCQVAQGMCHLLKDDELHPKLLSLVRSRQFQTRSEEKVEKLAKLVSFPQCPPQVFLTPTQDLSAFLIPNLVFLPSLPPPHTLCFRMTT